MGWQGDIQCYLPTCLCERDINTDIALGSTSLKMIPGSNYKVVIKSRSQIFLKWESIFSKLEWFMDLANTIMIYHVV